LLENGTAVISSGSFSLIRECTSSMDVWKRICEVPSYYSIHSLFIIYAYISHGFVSIKWNINHPMKENAVLWVFRLLYTVSEISIPQVSHMDRKI
jgi:hypothetical protein